MATPETTTSNLRRLLLTWYRANKRSMPWRDTRDPYSIWISEAMLQQTRVETVIPYWERFIEKFPDVHTLATADADDVLGAWAGLGYYSRARNLQAAARVIETEHGGRLPDEVETLMSLPGIGRYTAGAVASIAFDRPAPVLDGNVKRVLTRLLGIREDIAKPNVVERLWREAEALVQGRDPGDLNQAMMELGATLCTPGATHCGKCPLVAHCDAHRSGDAKQLPIKARKKKPRRVEAVAALVLRRGRALVVKRPSRGLLAGLWDLPGAELSAGTEPSGTLRDALSDRVGLTVADVSHVGSVEHIFTHRHLTLHVFRCTGTRGRTRITGFDAHQWVSQSAISDLPHAAVTAKALALLADEPN
jgi:A/G-specific adenine glycosylase